LPDTTSFDQLRVILVATRNPLNLGAAARAMSNFGFRRLRVVNPYQVAFREARSAVGASDVLKNAEEYGSVGEAVADCSLVVGSTAAGRRELRHPLRRLDSGAPLIHEELGAGRQVALLFGSEKTGLSNQDFSHCHWLLHIPTHQENVSMNLGQAAAVCLYEISRGTQDRQQTPQELLASAADAERITTTLLDALYLCGYLKKRDSADAEEKVRRLVRRMRLPADDATVCLGILRQIMWKLRRSESQIP
jgi:tRNA/rRNA methyltransferase